MTPKSARHIPWGTDEVGCAEHREIGEIREQTLKTAQTEQCLPIKECLPELSDLPVLFSRPEACSCASDAVSLAYRGLTGPGRTADVGGSYRIYELGVFYTGGAQFVIGGDFSLSRVALREGAVPDLDAVQFRIVTRIDF